MSASMAEVLAKHQWMAASPDPAERCTCGIYPAAQTNKSMAAHQAEQLAANGYGKLPEPVTEWASAFRATGARYNYHHTKAEAEDFVKEMKEVGVDMVVITRQRTPETTTEWRPE